MVEKNTPEKEIKSAPHSVGIYPPIIEPIVRHTHVRDFEFIDTEYIRMF
jgi:hypothetical protein